MNIGNPKKPIFQFDFFNETKNTTAKFCFLGRPKNLKAKTVLREPYQESRGPELKGAEGPTAKASEFVFIRFRLAGFAIGWEPWVVSQVVSFGRESFLGFLRFQ